MNVTVPKPQKSTPQEVRDFFYAVLTENYGFKHDQAEGIVSKWRYGRMKEMREFDITTYKEIFGTEVGGILYGNRHNVGSSEGLIISGSILLSFGLFLLFIALMNSEEAEVSAFFGVFGMALLVIGAVLLVLRSLPRKDMKAGGKYEKLPGSM